jgi:hypothetical protein
MTSDKPVTEERAGRRSVAEELSALVRDDARAVLGWACLIGASLIIFRLSEGTQYHQLAAGILMSSSTLFVLMAICELLWRLLVDRNS